ncbi:hypothetical protein MSG28_000888 [Choristoneura fumiferana]|uniref:Uncharacterized protein n=1 Tax=Choristoneura fumiferana TaxID=7141 RepID=A0ACC0K2M5_CHOFU|nr:hypothetical protein MSG28_000888 [Choristoneura fumiferana]
MKTDEEAVSPPTPSPLDRTTLPPPSAQPARHVGDRNIFEGDGSSGLYGNLEYNAKTNSTTSHTSSRPMPWAYPDQDYGTWDD